MVGSDRRLTIICALGGAALVVAWLLRPALAHWIDHRVATASIAPAALTMNRLVDQSDDPLSVLEQLWQTQRLVQRLFVIRHIQFRVGNDPQKLREVWPIIFEAAFDADVDVQHTALSILRQLHDPVLLPYAPAALTHPDAEVQRWWLWYVQHVGDRRYAPIILPLVTSDDQAVRSTAAATLRDWSGIDAQLKFASDFSEYQMAAAVWAQWIQDLHLTPPEDIQPAPPWNTLPSMDFSLPDLQRRHVSPADFRGKVVLLNFWATWCPPCIAEIPGLIEFQRLHPDDVVILGISVDGFHTHSPDLEDHHDHDDHDLFTEAIPLVARFVDEYGVNYPVLMDPDGKVTAAHVGEGLPTTVWIDPAGRIRLRYVGERSVAVMQRIFENITLTGP